MKDLKISFDLKLRIIFWISVLILVSFACSNALSNYRNSKKELKFNSLTPLEVGKIHSYFRNKDSIAYQVDFDSLLVLGYTISESRVLAGFNKNEIRVLTSKMTKSDTIDLVKILNLNEKSIYRRYCNSKGMKKKVSTFQPIKKNKKPFDKDDVKPVYIDKIDISDAKAFARSILIPARRIDLLTGVPMEILIAQAITESKSGSSYLAKNANNYFGIKCQKKSHKKHDSNFSHCLMRSDDHPDDRFIKFRNFDDSMLYYALLLKKPRYKWMVSKLTYSKYKDVSKSRGKSLGINLGGWRNLTVAEKWAYGLYASGYATDKYYSKKLISVLRSKIF